MNTESGLHAAMVLTVDKGLRQYRGIHTMFCRSHSGEGEEAHFNIRPSIQTAPAYIYWTTVGLP